MANDASYDYSKNAELIKAAQGGDKAAMEELITGNMGLVRSIVPRFADRGAEYEDLIQIGTMGMINSAVMIRPSWRWMSSPKSYVTDSGSVLVRIAVPE